MNSNRSCKQIGWIRRQNHKGKVTIGEWIWGSSCTWAHISSPTRFKYKQKQPLVEIILYRSLNVLQVKWMMVYISFHNAYAIKLRGWTKKVYVNMARICLLRSSWMSPISSAIVPNIHISESNRIILFMFFFLFVRMLPSHFERFWLQF